MDRPACGRLTAGRRTDGRKDGPADGARRDDCDVAAAAAAVAAAAAAAAERRFNQQFAGSQARDLAGRDANLTPPMTLLQRMRTGWAVPAAL